MGESKNNTDRVKQIFNSSQAKSILMLTILYILFHSFFENLFSVALVKPFLRHCTSSALNDVIFIAIFLGIVVFCIYRISKRYYISDKRIFISIILFFFLGYYRITSHVWGFESFTFCDGLKYIDVIFTFLVGDFLVKISFYLFNEEEADDKENKGFCLDAPLSESGIDQLKRENLVKQVCERLENTANKDASFAIGVTSEWGNGKTSFLNLIKRNLKRNLDHDKKQRIIIDYNPWLNCDRKSATLSFFDEMSSALRAYDSSLSNDILKYAKMLIDSSAGKYANLLNACLSLDGIPTLRERFEEINDAIKRTRLQIIVFIDDIDRLYDSEILEVLSLIRNSANFSNTIFIVAYDRNYLVAALKKVNNYHPHAYLEKIFQLELPLPQYEKSVLIELLLDKLFFYFDYFESCKCDGYSRYKRDKEELSRIVANPALFYSDGIKNIRDINRLVNSFLISYDLLKGEIVLSDLLNLELLRVKYPGVYELLANKKDVFFKEREFSYSGEATLTFVYVSGERNFSKYLMEHTDEVSILKSQIQDVEKYVNAIFYGERANIYNSIISPMSIDRYFHYSLLNGNLSFIKVSNLIKDKSDSNFWKYVEENAGKTLAFKGLLERVDCNESNDYKRIVCSYLYVASRAEKKYHVLLFDGIWALLVGDGAKGYNGDDMDIDLNNRIPSIIYRDFIHSMMSHLLDENSKNMSFLNYYDITKPSNSYSDSINYKKGANLFFRLCAKNWFDIFVENIIEVYNVSLGSQAKDEKTRLYAIKSGILDVFDNKDSNFQSFLNQLNENEIKGLKEFKNFYQKLMTNKFVGVEYNFKVIKPKD